MLNTIVIMVHGVQEHAAIKVVSDRTGEFGRRPPEQRDEWFCGILLRSASSSHPSNCNNEPHTPITVKLANRSLQRSVAIPCVVNRVRSIAPLVVTYHSPEIRLQVFPMITNGGH